MGEKFNEIAPELREKYMEAFLKWPGISDVTRKLKHPTVPQPLGFLKQNFQRKVHFFWV